jgi:quinol monooxygenase YgiN
MLTVIYQGTIKKGKEKEYQDAWHQCAEYFVNHCGALNSSLYKTENNIWVAISKWPDKETRDRVWHNSNLPPTTLALINKLKDCIESYQEIALHLVDTITNKG